MKKAVLIILPLFLGLFVSTSFAGEVTLFGPKEFLRTTGKPNVYTDTFSAAPLEGKLSIKNGDEDGEHRISSALISVNGEQVFRPNDFNQQVYRLEAPVNLAEDNSIRVELRSKPGSYLTVQVTRKEESPTVTLTADPETIHIGESSTLTWTTTHADSAIGSVSTQPGTLDLLLDGSMPDWPTETTTYTITATGPGGTATASVTVTVTTTGPPPTVEISAKDIGDGLFRLTWSSTNAYGCVIEPDTGSVGVSGSILVSPAAATTYTITATGPGGTATASVTITFPPVVWISGNPWTICIGESFTLTWTTTYADSAIGSVSTQPGTFDLPLDGSISVLPTETTTYTITATGPDGTATASVTVTVIPICISIASPHDGETISRPDIMVEGTITNTTGHETGVTVNGIVAIVYGDHFVANHVSLQEGGNTITATATDTDANTATASIGVYAETAVDYITITADTESGISPLETTLSVEGSFTFAAPLLTYTGPGAVDLDGPVDNEYNVGITTEGIYYFTAEVDYQGNTYTDTIATVVLNQAELDALLTAKWDGMKTSLINNNIEGALNYFHESSKKDYQEIFNLLRARLPHIVSAMREIELIYSEDRLAKYRIKREEEVQGQIYDITYYIYFVKDFNGLWHIESF